MALLAGLLAVVVLSTLVFLKDGAAAPLAPAAPPRYLALGDSYTIGEGVAPAARWPAQLAALLTRHGIRFAPPEIVARTGWTTADLSAALDREPPRGSFALVSLQIGVNDQFQGGQADAAYRRRFRRLLERAIGWAGGEPGRVLVLSIPDWGVTPFGAGRGGSAADGAADIGADIGAEIDRFNAVNREETARVRARFVDITPESRQAAADRSFFAPDGLHPSAKQYAAWAGLAFDPAQAALGTVPMKVGGLTPMAPAASPPRGSADRRRAGA